MGAHATLRYQSDIRPRHIDQVLEPRLGEQPQLEKKKAPQAYLQRGFAMLLDYPLLLEVQTLGGRGADLHFGGKAVHQKLQARQHSQQELCTGTCRSTAQGGRLRSIAMVGGVLQGEVAELGHVDHTQCNVTAGERGT